MRSSTPKVLHELCGAPMVLWPVRAALGGGRGARGRRRLAGARAREVLPEGVELAVQPQPNGTGGAVAAAIGGAGAGGAAVDGPVLVLSGDVPLRRAPRRSTSCSRRTRERRGGDDGDDACSRTRAATAASCATRRARCARGRDEERRATRAQAELQIREVNTGIYAFDAGALREALPRLSAENAQGELYLPQALDVLRADGEHGRGARARGRGGWCSASTTASALARVRKLAQRAINERHMRAGVTIVDPAATVIERRRADRPGHGDRAVHDDPRRDEDRRRLHDPALLSRRLRARGRRERRPVRLPAPRHGAARGREGRARSSRSRTPTSARARRSRTSPTSATPTSARARTSARRRSRPTTTGSNKHRTTIGERRARPASTRRSSRR